MLRSLTLERFFLTIPYFLFAGIRKHSRNTWIIQMLYVFVKLKDVSPKCVKIPVFIRYLMHFF